MAAKSGSVRVDPRSGFRTNSIQFPYYQPQTAIAGKGFAAVFGEVAPPAAKHWSLTTLRAKLIKVEAKVGDDLFRRMPFAVHEQPPCLRCRQ